MFTLGERVALVMLATIVIAASGFRLLGTEQQMAYTITKPLPLETTKKLPAEVQEGTVLNLNAATVPDLQRLPGIGPVLAKRIVSYRKTNGEFTSVQELCEIEGIGEKTLSRIMPHVQVK